MGNKAQYQTRQYKQIVACLEELGDRHITIPQLEVRLHEAGIPIGTATIYRHIEKLVAQGRVKKYLMEGVAGASYQYQPEHEACALHFHLKCEVCGRLVHLDCKETQTFQRHVGKRHRFQVNYTKTVIYGTCEDCLAKKDGTV